MACAGLLRARHTLVLRDHLLEWTCRGEQPRALPLRLDSQTVPTRPDRPVDRVDKIASTGEAHCNAVMAILPSLRCVTSHGARSTGRGPIEAISVKRACGDPFRMRFGEARHA